MTETFAFDSAREFLSTLRSSHPRWESEGSPWNRDWVFRGQRDASWKIEPSAWRAEIEQHRLFKVFSKEYSDDDASNMVRSHTSYFKGSDSHNLETARRLYAFKKFEYYTAKQFIELADEIGFRVPEARKHIEGVFRYSEPFSAPATIADNLPVEEFSDAILLAQHHGIATRFVDWARDPIIAACFAAQGWEGDSDITVYGLNTVKARHTQYRLITPTRFEFGFLHAQGGLFTVRFAADAEFCANGVWPSIEDELGTDVLQKLVLRAEYVEELKQLLWLERRTRAHLMPTLDNVTATLNELWNGGPQPED